MSGAPQNQGPPSPPILLLLCLLLLLLPGCLCPLPPPPPPPSRSPVTPTTVETSGSSRCSRGLIQVSSGPTSLSGTVGQRLTLQCLFRSPSQAKASWFRVSNGSRYPQEAQGPGRDLQLEAEGRLLLTFRRLAHGDAGFYYCRVEGADGGLGQSCGTFVRVRAPELVPFLDLSDVTKNRIITAEGVLLLLFAAGPGLFLLFRKRLANERLLQMKKSALEEENLYEGLNLDECSMYEDISRGLQPTYQDVGSFQASDSHLEKP